MNRVASILAVLTIATAAIGAFAYNESTYATWIAVDTVSERLDVKITQDLINGLRERIWKLKEKFGEDCGPVKEECRNLHGEIQRLRDTLPRRK